MPTWKQIKENPNLFDIFYLRQQIISQIRAFFEQKGFLEVFTPILQPAVIPESYLDLFSTIVLDRNKNIKKAYLIPSPEVSIKKMLAAGLPKCFEITKVFRNRESGSDFHNYEFTILEWYRTKADYMDILKDVQDLLIFIKKKSNNKKIDLSRPWKKISVVEALKKFANLDFDEITDKKNKNNYFPVDKISETARKKGYQVKKNNTWEELFNQIYLNEIEPKFRTFTSPTIIYDYPAPMAALAKLKKDDKRLCERFEIYVKNLELADCCTELTDYKEQKERFKKSLAQISKSDKNKVAPDNDFLEAIKSGIPPCAGIALGIDRLIMLFGNKKNIRDTLLTSD